MTLTRAEFLLSLGFAAGRVASAGAPVAANPKVLLVVAHPDDEYAFAATVYRIARELGGTVDQVIITNGEAGYRYSQLAEQVYHASLTREDVGRLRLPEIRRRETLAAGRILGIRKHYFLKQPDTRFTLDAREPLMLWDMASILNTISRLYERERYDFVLTLLPTEDTHGHHKAATILALEAAARLSRGTRPVILGAEPANLSDAERDFAGLPEHPETAAWTSAPVFHFDRTAKFGFHDSLSYQIVVNWMIAEHKSQGLFQTECNKHDHERFWLFAENEPDALVRTRHLFDNLRRPSSTVTALDRR